MMVNSSILVLILALGTQFAGAALNADNQVTCGRSMIRKGRVKGGNDAAEGEFPWLVSIRFGAGVSSVHLCGGSLVNNRFVLTAAHCMQNKVFTFINVMAGEYDVRGRSNHEQVRSIKNVYMHEQFGRGYLNDIAILELNEPVTWSTYVRPICLPDSTSDAGDNSLDSQMMTIAGWGYTDEDSNGGGKPQILQKANVPIVDLNTCQKWFDLETQKTVGNSNQLLLFKNSHICAGYANGKKDSCHGDSGGPLMKIDADGREVIVGVVSSGIGCGRPKVPGIYTRIVSYIPWIREILKQNGVNLI